MENKGYADFGGANKVYYGGTAQRLILPSKQLNDPKKLSCKSPKTILQKHLANERSRCKLEILNSPSSHTYPRQNYISLPQEH